MKMCQSHWDMMRAEIANLGLTDWVATNGATAVEQLADQVKQGPTPVNYDPLMDAHNMIMMRAMEGLGLMVMSPEFGCPICFLNERRSPEGWCTCGHPMCPNREGGGGQPIADFETWIKGPTGAPAAAKAHMVAQGWVAA